MRRKNFRRQQELVCWIYGLNRKGDVVRISVYRKGTAVKLWGPNESHLVPASNDKGVHGWVREAVLVWNLTDTFEIPYHLHNSSYEKMEVDRIKEKGEKIKERLGGDQT